MSMQIGVGFLGAGTVGGALIRRLVFESEAVAAKTGLELAVTGVAVRDKAKPRGAGIPARLLTDRPGEVVDDPDAAIVVEVMGGLDPAGELVKRALRSGKAVVTANKELMAARGSELLEAAEEAGVSLLFEAAVGGGIPIIRPLSESLAGERITSVLGIVNGTTNYILTRMVDEGAPYEEVLAEAQRLGYAEADPSADVGGRDAAAKAAILAQPGLRRLGGRRLGVPGRNRGPGGGGHRVRPPPGIHAQAAGHRRGFGGGHRGAGPPHPGAARPSAGLGAGGHQRRVRVGSVDR